MVSRGGLGRVIMLGLWCRWRWGWGEEFDEQEISLDGYYCSALARSKTSRYCTELLMY